MAAHRGISCKRLLGMVAVSMVILAVSAASASAQSCVVNVLSDSGPGGRERRPALLHNPGECCQHPHGCHSTLQHHFRRLLGCEYHTPDVRAAQHHREHDHYRAGSSPVMTLDGFNLHFANLVTISSGATRDISGLTIANEFDGYGIELQGGTLTGSNCICPACILAS